MSSAETSDRARRPWPLLAALGLVLAAAAALTLLAGPLGYRWGLWPLRTALLELPRAAMYLGLAGAALGALGLVANLLGRRRAWVLVALVALLAGSGSAYVPISFRELDHTVPPINDITTDTEHPPEFQAVLPLRAAAHAEPVTYGGAAVAAQQKAGYPDIVPLRLDVPFATGFARALQAARSMGWTIVAADGELGRIEATDSTFWYGFTDDIVVLVRPDGSGTRIDVRSKSRVGRSDLGTNARRIRAYLAAVKAASG